jgi:hypothetical protein
MHVSIQLLPIVYHALMHGQANINVWSEANPTAVVPEWESPPVVSWKTRLDNEWE